MDLTEWCSEVMATGDIVQDDDNSVPSEEAEHRFNRYVELVDEVTGDEPDQVFRCLIASVREQDDYGARQTVLGALSRFQAHRQGSLFAASMTDTIERVPSFAGELLCGIANRGGRVLDAFNSAARELDSHEQGVIAKFVAQEEVDGWLDGPRRGAIRIG
jgi:hypothetical protein